MGKAIKNSSLPVSFKDFSKDPVKAILYLAIIAIVSLFTYLQVSSNNEKKLLKEQLLKCDTKNFTQDVELKQLRDQYIEVASLFNNLKGKMETLQSLGKIQ